MFFITLGIVFAGAVYLRLRAVKPAIAATNRGAASTAGSGSAATPTDAIYPEASVDTGTIVDVSANATAPAVTAPSAGLSLREQRYQELLRSSPPAAQAAAPPKPAEEKPSFLKRVASAIGLGGDKEKKPPAPAPRQPNPQRPPQQASNNQQQSQNQQQTDNKPKEPPQPAEETDPESDTRAPQLVGLDFMPRQVQDGETLTLAVMAQDDLSGIRTISGVIANPSGATVNGFAAQREPDTNRFLAKIVIPKDAAEGNWHIKYLTMADNASNSVNLAYGQQLSPGMATFQVVSSRSDSKGPELKGLTLERYSMSAGEKNTVFVTAEDDKAGVHIISGVFVSPKKKARIGFGCRAGASSWECTVNIPDCVDCGRWQLEQVQLQDKANNTTTVRADNQLVQQAQIDISGDRCDGQAPLLTGLALSPPVVSNAEKGLVAVTAQVQDDTCGGATLSGLVTGPSGQRLNILFDPSKDGQHFTGRIVVEQHLAKGTYKVAWIQTLDKGQNMESYSATNPVIANVTFRVE